MNISMPEVPDTRISLILRLPRSADGTAWREFVELYEPLIMRFARSRRLQDSDAHELVQRVFVAVAGSVGRWQPDPSRGTFRAWLFRIARNQLIKQVTARARERSVGGTSNFVKLHQELPNPSGADDSQESLIDQEYRQVVFELAAERVRKAVLPQTWEAFRLSMVDEIPCQQVAKTLKMSIGAVYIARSRVVARLREVVQLLEAEDALHR
ncbi:MAG: sigma-70 family RNA polymerase sigma factor [Pirellulaceae bacterium]|nr:sigma-70 family RNA polymerase sigma factor [Pirellulaceae bacterium]